MLWNRLDLVARSLSPMAITLLLVMVSVLPMHIPFFGTVSPVLSLMAVYYWSIFRPDLMPSFAVFGAGLFQDILSGTPLGRLLLFSCWFAWSLFPSGSPSSAIHS